MENINRKAFLAGLGAAIACISSGAGVCSKAVKFDDIRPNATYLVGRPSGWAFMHGHDLINRLLDLERTNSSDVDGMIDKLAAQNLICTDVTTWLDKNDKSWKSPQFKLTREWYVQFYSKHDIA